MKKTFYTSESVTIGHPDKMCDYISDSILDELLKQDKYSKVACETVAYKNNILVTGEITTNAVVDIEKVVRNCVREIGYDNETIGINYENCKVDIVLSKQSQDIALGTNENVGGAGDQGMMFGYATNETEEYMPITLVLANKLAKRLEFVRKQNIVKGLKPDGKTQVTVEFEDNKIKRVDAIVIASQHDENTDINKLREDIKNEVICKVIDSSLIDNDTKIFINSTGRFVIGGPLGDVGLTGRKIIIDTYGGCAKHGGGAFSGKDSTKVDRSGAYMARFVAKNIVANKLADKCEIQIAYVIGVKQAVSINVNCFGTEKISIEEIENIIKNNFDFEPQNIIDRLQLRTPIFSKLSAYGHFGRTELDLPWEQIIDLKM